MVTRRADHLANTVFLANIARVDSKACRTGLRGLDGPAIMEMYVGNDRHRAFSADDPQGTGAVLIGTGYPHDVGTGLGGGRDLGHGATDIGCQRIGHGLHRNRRVTANRH